MNLFYLQWHITNKCNNRCMHCYQNSFSHDSDTKFSDIKLIASDLLECCDKLNAKSIVTITGGDPCQHIEFKKIIEFLGDQVDILNIMGNPEQLLTDQSVIKSLKNANISGWQFSLDGLEDTHDSIRSNGSFSSTIEAIKKLSLNNIAVSVLSTVLDKNIDEIISVMELAYSSGAYSWDFSRYIPQKGDCGIPPKKYELFLHEVKLHHRKYEKIGAPALSKEPLLFSLSDNLNDSSDLIITNGCGLGSLSFCLLPDTTVMACRRLPTSILGKMTEGDTFFDMFLNNQKMENFRSKGFYGVCQDCEKYSCCRGCRAASFAASSSEMSKDPQCFINI